MSPNGFVHFRVSAAIMAVTFATTLTAQNVIPASGPNGAVRTFSGDDAILESQDVRKDLNCTVEPIKPELGFDLRFHTGYEVTLPLKEVSGTENALTMIYRVTYAKDKNRPVYFSQHFTVPKIEDDAKGDAYLEGTFDVGEGEYHVDWMMRDRSERVCSFFWDSTAQLSQKDK